MSTSKAQIIKQLQRLIAANEENPSVSKRFLKNLYTVILEDMQFSIDDYLQNPTEDTNAL